MTGGFRDLTHCTIEPNDGGYWLFGYGTYSSGVLRGQPLFRRFRWFQTYDEAKTFFDENAPNGMPLDDRPEGDFEGVKWMSGSGAPDVLDEIY